MNILIVGLGVVGGSYAKALHRAGYRELYGVDPDLDTLACCARPARTRAHCCQGRS